LVNSALDSASLVESRVAEAFAMKESKIVSAPRVYNAISKSNEDYPDHCRRRREFGFFRV